jgi:hypothetical protein
MLYNLDFNFTQLDDHFLSWLLWLFLLELELELELDELELDLSLELDYQLYSFLFGILGLLSCSCVLGG